MPQRKGAYVLFDPSMGAKKIVDVLMGLHSKIAADQSITSDIEEREDTNPKEGKSKYGSVTFADPKNHKYPLDTPEHVRAAASYWAMSKNRSKYSQEDQTTISHRIKAAEKKFKIGNHSDK
jgi:hypothetical protein